MPGDGERPAARGAGQPSAHRRQAEEVAITYVGHSTYYIDTPEGVRIATDFNGAYRTGRLPDVITMNRAHSTHYTLFPDPKIPHVLHGWGENGQAAHVSTRVGDVYIRNVPTDIRRYYGEDSSGAMLKDGNSIFIFEVAGLCIGHLGHLHHKLDDTHFAAIGRLDIVMVPIDGTYTMSLDGVSEITKRLRSSVVLPMHRFATPLDEFMRLIGQQFVIDQRSERTLEDFTRDIAGHADGDHSGWGVTRRNLPRTMQRERSLSGPAQRMIESNGIRLNIAEQGDGPPVLLCHGIPGVLVFLASSARRAGRGGLPRRGS